LACRLALGALAAGACGVDWPAARASVLGAGVRRDRPCRWQGPSYTGLRSLSLYVIDVHLWPGLRLRGVTPKWARLWHARARERPL